jgi:hypothetical protein
MIGGTAAAISALLLKTGTVLRNQASGDLRRRNGVFITALMQALLSESSLALLGAEVTPQ